RVRELQQDKWIQTTQNPSDIVMTSGLTTSGVYFGNWHPSVIVDATSFNTREGSSFSGEVATFVDSGGAEPLVSYSASINWGDETAAAAGTITFADGTFHVTASHTFAEEGAH